MGRYTNGEAPLIDLDLIVVAETEKAIGVVNDKGKTVWLPRSLIEIERQTMGQGANITLPEWLAEDRELS